MRWFVDGGRNIKFFHFYVNGRRKRLRIDEITTMEGDVINTKENIEAKAVRYFEKQFIEQCLHQMTLVY